MTPQRPLAALLTPRGRGAVATIACAGDVTTIDATGLFRAANGKPLVKQPADRVAFGHWGDEPAEEVVVCRTADDRVEIHCHGGEAAAGRILALLESVGAERVAWWEFVERTDGPFAADVAEALAAATTARTAALIARQADGPLRGALARLIAANSRRDRNKILAMLDGLLAHADFGLHLTRPRKVVLYGRPNAGKSSLVNALVGFERAIVFDRPGTTRDVVTAETAFDGWPVRLSDTAGLRADAEDLEAAGIARARDALERADVRILVIDRSRPPEPGDGDPHDGPTPHLVVANKADLPDARDAAMPPGAITVSAKTGAGVRDLIGRLVSAIAPVLPPDDAPIPVTSRQVDAMNAARRAIAAGDDEAFRREVAGIAPRAEGERRA